MGRILVGIDGSPPSRRALDHVLQQARQGEHEVVLLTVIPPQVRHTSLSSMMPAGLALPPELSQTFEETARLRLDEMAEQMKRAGVKVRAELRAGKTVDEFVKLAEELGVSEIVIGHKAFEPGQVEMGPNATAIVERAKVRVTLVP